MAIHLQSPQSSVVVVLLLITSVASALNSTDSQELSSALESLRNQGYTLFTNAVTTSDLQYELLSAATAFTVFAPKDEMVFALDMATDAAVYLNALRYHIVPNHRHDFAHLQNLSSPFLDTLLPHYAILVGKVQSDDVLSETPTVTVMVDGVRISNPDVFLGSRLAVHGIDGILLGGLNMTQDSDTNRSESMNIPAEEMFQFNPPPSPVTEFDRNNSAAAEGTGTPPASQFGRDNFLADGNLTPVTDWSNVPVKTSPKDHQMEKSKKKVEKHHRKGRRRRHDRRHTASS
ncbi:hypothetical protein ACS0TY_030657 [Phlomoides rotata]